jgi:hypothetical protein
MSERGRGWEAEEGAGVTGVRERWMEGGERDGERGGWWLEREVEGPGRGRESLGMRIREREEWRDVNSV